MIGKYLKVHKN